MALLPLVPETSASTDSATSAGVDRVKDPNGLPHSLLFGREVPVGSRMKSYTPRTIHGPNHGKEIKEKKFDRMHELMTVS